VSPQSRKPERLSFAVPASELLQSFGTDTEKGLSMPESNSRLERYGPNKLAEAPASPAWRMLLRQFTEVVVLMLIGAAVIAGIVGEWADSLAILAIVLLNGVIGFLQEQRAERALDALQRISTPTAKVIRDGHLRTIDTRQLVPGDIINIEAGDHVPADCRLLKSFNLRTQEAALTGESLPEEKQADIVLPADTPLADRQNMVYLGTVVAAGKVSAVVVATGMTTELGRIAGLLQRQEPESTPLQRRLAELGRILLVVVLGIIAIVFTLQLLRGGDAMEVFILSVSLAVAAVPEGLPAVVTVALALGLQRMVKRHALIRRLPSVETLGSVTVICSDKTGTLTRNEMTVREIIIADGDYQITGTGYSPVGGFLPQPGDVRVNPGQDLDLTAALVIAAWCNNAEVIPKRGGSDWEAVGDPTEAALLVSSMKAGIDRRDNDRRVVYEIPFDSERKMMTVVVRQGDDSLAMYSKGAPEVIVERCQAEQRSGTVHSLTEERRQEIRRASANMATRALRVLALAYRPVSAGTINECDERDLIFSALVGMIDPPREEAREAVQLCRSAGIRPVMITGDHPTTALAIARELTIADEMGRVVTGKELDVFTDEQLLQQVDKIDVYARVAAEHKLRVVRAWKKRGEVVAMTGDGVNDAPAVKAADIGIAMGVTGSDVTREASDMVLLDDNFASIVNAVEEGRTIYDNIQKVVHYLLSSNISEILLVFIAAVLGWPAPLIAIQLLWLNLITDGVPALALSMESPERDVMRRRPHRPHEPIITSQRGLQMLLYGSLMAAAALTAFAGMYDNQQTNLPHARTAAFCVLAFAQLFFSFSCRSQRFTLPELGLVSNPQLLAAVLVSGLLQLAVVTLPFARPLFEVATVFSLREWVLIISLALVPVSLIEVAKLMIRLFRNRAVSAQMLPPDKLQS
jgi:Ca2+-transporting ATPase